MIPVPTVYPRIDQFHDVDQYLNSIEAEIAKYGILKIQCPNKYKLELEQLDLSDYHIPNGKHIISQEISTIYRDKRRKENRWRCVPSAGMAGDAFRFPEEINNSMTSSGASCIMRWAHISNKSYHSRQSIKTMDSLPHKNRYGLPLYVVDIEQSILKGTDFPWQFSRIKTNKFRDMKQKVPGVNSPFVYIGSHGAVTGVHHEDGGASSMNVLIQGASKQWRSIRPKDNDFFKSLTDLSHFQESLQCPEYISHKCILPYAETLLHHELDVMTTTQKPGDIIITYPMAYHWVWNEGRNVAEAWNHADEKYVESLPLAGTCRCPLGTGVVFTKEDFLI